MLSLKQEKFCVEYAKSGNARQSYINAGYKNKNENTIDACASRLLSNAKVKSRLAELQEEYKSDKIADIQEMQEILTAIIRGEESEEIVVVESTDLGVSEATTKLKKPSIRERISAIEKLGKMQGAFNNKIQIEGILPVVISGDEELED